MSSTSPKRYSVFLKGHITAESPICTNPPGSEKEPAAMLPRMIVVRDGAQIEVPYFPAAGLRGKLRRLSIAAAMRGANEGLTLDDYYLNAIGGVKSSGEEDNNVMTHVAMLRAKNPIVGLFGANSPWVNGVLAVGHLIPTTLKSGEVKTSIVSGVRLDDLRKSETSLSYLDEDVKKQWQEVAYNNQQRSKKTRQLEKLTADYKGKKAAEMPEDIKAEVSRLEEEIKAHAMISGSVSTQLPLSGYEVLPIGTTFDSKFVLNDATEDEIGMFLAALEELAAMPFIGSRTNQGNGEISGKWDVTIRERGELKVKRADQILLTQEEGLVIDNDLLKDLLSNFRTKVQQRQYDLTDAE